MSKLPSLREMLDAGVHFGHVTSRWNPKMKPYIFTARDKIHVINLEQTRQKLDEAVQFLHTVVAKGGTVLFVGTKLQAKDLVQAAAAECGMPYMTQRWFGGALTNFNILRANVKTLEEIETREASGELDHLTKKERLKLDEKKAKLLRTLQGVRNLMRVPQALVVADAIHESIAISEARVLGIPVIALIDTNADPSTVDYPIPANDDAAGSLKLLLSVLSEAITAARAEGEKTKAEQELKLEKEASAPIVAENVQQAAVA